MYDLIKVKSYKISIYSLLGIIFLSVLVLQISRSIYIDIYSIVATRLDLLGYLLSMMIGLMLFLWGMKKNIIRFFPVVLFLIFIILLALNVETKSEYSYKSILFSRFGLLTWFLYGMYSAISIAAIKSQVVSRPRSITRTIPTLILILTLPVAWLTYTYLDERVFTISYQAVSNSATILILLLTFTFSSLINLESKDRFLNLSIYFFLLICTCFVYAISLMQSTSIIAFWLAALPLTLATLILHKISISRLLSFFVFILLVLFLTVNLFLDGLLSDTRFSSISEGDWILSSVQTRYELLQSFSSQFNVAPILGNYSAEIIAGSGEGKFIHSLPLSLLTHTGLIGFWLFSIMLFSVIKSEYSAIESNSDSRETVIGFRMLLLILFLSTSYTFFTWIPLWFMLGFSSIKKNKFS